MCTRKWFVLLMAPVLIAGCTPPEAGVETDVAAAVSSPTEVHEGTAGGDGSDITLLSLTAAQLESADVRGELACAYSADGGTMLVARADVLPDGDVRAAINHNGHVELLGNGRAGGFNDLLDGITLTGRGLTMTVERHASNPTGDESTVHVATLTVQRADGAARTYTGTWTCGP